MSTDTQKQGSKPYITINKLAEYMMADSIRRRQIIVNLKKDNDFTKVYYSEVRNIIAPFFASGYDGAIITDAMDKVSGKASTTDWEKNDNSNSIMALQCIEDTEMPDLSEFQIIDAPVDLKCIALGGVEVTIKPELVFLNTHTGKFGALKMHIAKTAANRLEEESRTYAATLLKYAFIVNGVSEKQVDSNACISWDIFLQQWNVAAASFKRRINALECACEEIAARWDNV